MPYRNECGLELIFVIYDYVTDAKSFTPAVGGMGIGSV